MKLHGKTFGAWVFKAATTLGPRWAGMFQKPLGTRGRQFPAPALGCPYSWLHFPPKCEYVFLYSSHGLSNSQIPNTDALYNFPVFFAACNLSGVWLDCLIFPSFCDLVNCFGGSRLSRDWRQARSFTPDRARPHIRVGVEWMHRTAQWVTVMEGTSVEEGADDEGSGTSGDGRRPGLLTSVRSQPLELVKTHLWIRMTLQGENEIDGGRLHCSVERKIICTWPRGGGGVKVTNHTRLGSTKVFRKLPRANSWSRLHHLTYKIQGRALEVNA